MNGMSSGFQGYYTVFESVRVCVFVRASFLCLIQCLSYQHYFPKLYTSVGLVCFTADKDERNHCNILLCC